MPTSSFQGSNYWVDVTFAPGAVDNEAPSFTSPSGVSVAENALVAVTVAASDTEPLAYSIAGGADAAAFSIDAATGVLSFVFAPDFEAPADADGNNVYQVTVAASDGFNLPERQTVTVTVTDTVDESGGVVSTLFGPAARPALIETGDTTDYELGTRFTPQEYGLIDSLRYWRGAADAGDTDTRTLTLWNDAGTALATVVVTSAPGQSGWQVGALSSPVAVAAGATYTVSYGTTQNYAASVNYFGAPYSGPDGLLSAPAGAGVYAAGGTGAYPTQSYLNANYWVDVGFRGDGIANRAPDFTLASATLAAAENQTAVATVTASDPEGDSLTFSIAGGDDAAAFTIGAQTGLLTFAASPNFEAPGDANGDNLYDLVLQVSDGVNPAVRQAVTVRVTDVAQEPPTAASTLFAAGDAPATIVTSDPTDYELGVEFVAATAGEVVALRYWRGAADAGDTDTRTLNLWDGAGTLLGTAQVTSTQGQTGWQTALLSSAVALDAGRVYVASYGTTQNYAYTGGYFVSDHVGPDGVLSAPAGAEPTGNGVYAANATGIFPTNSYNAANYWVDVMFDPYDLLG